LDSDQKCPRRGWAIVDAEDEVADMTHGWIGAILFAQEAAAAPEQTFLNPNIIILPVMLVMLYYFMIALPDRARQKQFQKMIGDLKKNDRVITSSGIYGFVANVLPDRDEVVLRIDDDKDIKIRVSKGSIDRVVKSKETETPAERQ
jgi:preprotein translocase subunit YajC